MSKSSLFEKSLHELQDIVSQLEKGELTLEDSLKQFEKGITLTRKCQEMLRKAEQKVQLLSESKPPTTESPNE